MVLLKKLLIGLVKVAFCFGVFTVWTLFLGSILKNYPNETILEKGLYIGMFLSIPACVVYGIFMLSKQTLKNWLLVFLLGIPLCLVFGILIFLANEPSLPLLIRIFAWMLIIIAVLITTGGGVYYF